MTTQNIGLSLCSIQGQLIAFLIQLESWSPLLPNASFVIPNGSIYNKNKHRHKDRWSLHSLFMQVHFGEENSKLKPGLPVPNRDELCWLRVPYSCPRRSNHARLVDGSRSMCLGSHTMQSLISFPNILAGLCNCAQPGHHGPLMPPLLNSHSQVSK